MSDTIKGDTLSKNRKESLGLAYINAKGRSQGLGRLSDSPEARAATTLHLAEALSPEAPPRKASDGLPIRPRPARQQPRRLRLDRLL